MPVGLLATALLTLLAGQADGRPPAGWRLERVVLVERHGVRSPTKPPEALAPYAAQPWPAWPVGPGELTERGRQGVVEMGRYLRILYAKEGLWPAGGCPAKPLAYVWADGQDQRTRESGQALLDGLFPRCGLTAEHGASGERDPLFDAVAAGVCAMDRDAARQAVMARAGGDLAHPGAGYERALKALQGVVAPEGGPRGLPPGPNRLSDKDDVKIDGPLGVGGTLAENLYLEYAEGFPLKEVGWGRISDEAAVAAFMPLHTIETDLLRKAPEVAAPRAALLLRTVLDALEGGPTPDFPGEPLAPASARLVAIAGHDTNIANLAGLLGLAWTLPGQPDDTPPGGALVFEAWRDAAGARWMRARFIYQTLAQLRLLSPLTDRHPPGITDVRLVCGQTTGPYCRADVFIHRIRQVASRYCKLTVGH